MDHKKLNRQKWLKRAAVVGLAALTLGVAIGTSKQQTLGADAGEAKVSLVDQATIKKGALIPFDLIYQVPNNKVLNKLVLYDPLDPVYEYQEAKVFSGNDDVTAQGKLEFDKASNTVSWIANKPGDWFNKQLIMRPIVKIPDNADLSKYLDKNTNKYRIYNVGHMITDDKDIPSKPVEVNPPDDKLPTVTKAVIDHEGQYGTSAKHDVGEEYTYKLNYHIPKNEKLTNIEFRDDLEDVLNLKGVVVKDQNGRDVTKENGSLVTDQAKESFVWTANKGTLDTMGDTDYTVIASASIKPNADLSNYYNKDTKQIEIPNVGEYGYNDQTIKSDPVKVIPEDSLKPSVTKQVKGLSGKYGDHDDVTIGKEYTYKSDFSFPTNVAMKDVELKDDLEDVLDLVKVVVTNESGKDVTDTDGTLKIDQDAESFIWTPKDVAGLGGKKYSAEITSKIKPGANLEKYLVNGKISIGNTIHLLIDGKDYPSPTPTVTPATVEPKVDKKIIANPDQLSDVFNLTADKSSSGNGDATTKTTGDGDANAKLNDAQPITSASSSSASTSAASSSSTSTASGAQPAGSTEQGPTNKSAAIDISKIKNASLVDNNEAKPGDIVMWLLTFTVGNKENMNRLILSDDLENVFDLKEVKLFDDAGNDVSQQGQLMVDQDKESFSWVAAKPSDWYSKTIYAAISAKIKTSGPDADLSNYKKGDYYEVPNYGDMLQNDTDYQSPKVVTRLPLTATPEKTTPGQPNSSSSSQPSGSSSSSVTPNTPAQTSATAKQEGVLPQTGRYVLQHKALIILLIVALTGAVVIFIWRKNAVKEVSKDGK